MAFERKYRSESGVYGAASVSLYLLVRVALAFLFVYAGGIKLVDPQAFARVIAGYDLIPEWALPIAAIGLPLLEIAGGIGLALDVRGSLNLITGLLLLFVLVLGYGIMGDLDVDCGCFGAETLESKVGLRWALARDFVLFGAVGYLYVTRRVWQNRAAAENMTKYS